MKNKGEAEAASFPYLATCPVLQEELQELLAGEFERKSCCQCPIMIKKLEFNVKPP